MMNTRALETRLTDRRGFIVKFICKCAVNKSNLSQCQEAI